MVSLKMDKLERSSWIRRNTLVRSQHTATTPLGQPAPAPSVSQQHPTEQNWQTLHKQLLGPGQTSRQSRSTGKDLERVCGGWTERKENLVSHLLQFMPLLLVLTTVLILPDKALGLDPKPTLSNKICCCRDFGSDPNTFLSRVTLSLFSFTGQNLCLNLPARWA